MVSAVDSFIDLFRAKSRPMEKCVVSGVVTRVRDDVVVIDVGLKYEGEVLRSEFTEEVRVGDVVEVFIVSYESGGDGKPVLSREIAVRKSSWAGLKSYADSEQPIVGKVGQKKKGGYAVALKGGIQAFCSIGKSDSVQLTEGSEYSFIVSSLEDSTGAVTVRLDGTSNSKLMPSVGEILEGTILKILTYGMLVNVNGNTGLLHRSKIYGLGANPIEQFFKSGDSITVKVLSVDQQSNEMTFESSSIASDIWKDIDSKIKVGDIVTGEIVGIKQYGLFVKLMPGLDGLVYIHEIGWNRTDANKINNFTNGHKIDVKVIDLDKAARKIHLSIKRLTDSPVNIFAAKHVAGDVMDVTITHVSARGISVSFNFENSTLDGYMKATDLSWTENIDSSLKKYSVGDKVKACVIDIERDENVVRFGVKQLTENPYDSSSSSMGSIVECQIDEIKHDYSGVFVKMKNSVRGFIPMHEMSKNRTERRVNRFPVGTKVNAEVISIDPRTKRVTLSIRLAETREDKRLINDYASKNTINWNLGDAISVQEKSTKA